MGDREFAGRQPFRKWELERPELKEIAGTAELQRLPDDVDPQRHRHAVADIFLEAGRPREAFRRMDHLRKVAVARIDPRPDLSAGCGILGDADNGGKVCIRADWQGSTDQPRQLSEPPAEAAEFDLIDLADINDGLAVGKTGGETAPD